jgi:hypothetical protein
MAMRKCDALSERILSYVLSSRSKILHLEIFGCKNTASQRKNDLLLREYCSRAD